MRQLVAAACLSYALVASSAFVSAAGQSASIWDGTFTVAQATRGKLQYENYCGQCHRDDLSGSNGPALAGETFLTNWDAATIGELFGKISRTMPRSQPRLPENVYIDVVSYILQVNGFPAGATELQQDSSGMGARVIGRDGPMAPQSGQLVRTVGCFTGDTATGWRLTSATTPVRSRTTDASSAADLQAAAREAPGSRTFALKAVDPGSDRLRGQRVEAKGLLTGESIALMSLGGVGAACTP